MCDRIIWFGKGLKQNHYSRGESKLSDHRSVRAIFTAQVQFLVSAERSENLLPRTFSSMTNSHDVYTDTEVLCDNMSSFQVQG